MLRILEEYLDPGYIEARRQFESMGMEIPDPEKYLLSMAASTLGRRGGKVGGKAKVPKGFSMMPAEKRRAAALKGLRARWAKSADAKHD